MRGEPALFSYTKISIGSTVQTKASGWGGLRCHLKISDLDVGRHDWTRTNDPHHVKVVL